MACTLHSIITLSTPFGLPGARGDASSYPARRLGCWRGHPFLGWQVDSIGFVTNQAKKTGRGRRRVRDEGTLRGLPRPLQCVRHIQKRTGIPLVGVDQARNGRWIGPVEIEAHGSRLSGASADVV